MSCWSVLKGDIMCAFDHFYHDDMHGLQAIKKACIPSAEERSTEFSASSLIPGIFDQLVLFLRFFDSCQISN
jgi:hypothetical protein